MRRFFILVSYLFFIVFILLSEIPEGYYDKAKGKTGYKLKTTLYHIIKNHTDIGYKKLFDAYKTTDTRPGNIVWDMYSDIPGSTPPYIYYHRKKTCGNYKKESDCYNREHSMPQSWFKKRHPMKSDLFHVYPTDGYVNHVRGSWPYGEVSNPAWTSKNGSKLGLCSFPGYSGTVFEPIDEYKGDFARTYFYLATRYENKIARWKRGTAKKVLDGSKEQVFKEWVIKLFLKWHQNDPVSQKETNRNDAVYELQKNRNPFIDHPEYVGKIWGDETETGD
jgi:endonuclease I